MESLIWFGCHNIQNLRIIERNNVLDVFVGIFKKHIVFRLMGKIVEFCSLNMLYVKKRNTFEETINAKELEICKNKFMKEREN